MATITPSLARRIAQRHGTSVEKLMKINGIDNARHLRIGANLVIPE